MEKKESPVLVAIISALGLIIAALVSSGYLRANSAAKRQDALEARVRYLESEVEKRDEIIASFQKKLAEISKKPSQGTPALLTPLTPGSEEQSKSVSSFVVNLSPCERSSSSLVCRFTVVNQRADDNFRLYVSDVYYSVMFDNLGREYRPSDGQLSEFTNSHSITKRLITGIPVNGSLTFVGIPTEVSSVAVLDVFCDAGNTRGAVEFRNVTIKNKG